MRKTLLFLAFSLLLIAVPALAQHRGGNFGGQHNGGQDHARPQQDRNQNRDFHRERPQPRPQQDRDRHVGDRRTDRDQNRDFHRDRNVNRHDRDAYRDRREPRGEFRRHWDGRRFDRDFFRDHWGYAHRFYWRRCGWYGPRFMVGSYFWFNGVYFEIIDPVPPYWYDDPVVVIYDDDCGCYYIVDPMYPGVRIHVGIRF